MSLTTQPERFSEEAWELLLAGQAQACGRRPEQVVLRSLDPQLLEPKASKSFPLRIAHFFTDINRVCRELAWQPRFNLVAGLKDSYEKDFRQQACQPWGRPSECRSPALNQDAGDGHGALPAQGAAQHQAVLRSVMVGGLAPGAFKADALVASHLPVRPHAPRL